jgi:hypothetical protein
MGIDKSDIAIFRVYPFVAQFFNFSGATDAPPGSVRMALAATIPWGHGFMHMATLKPTSSFQIIIVRNIPNFAFPQLSVVSFGRRFINATWLQTVHAN